MGSNEYIIALCFVFTIWTNTVNADIDCRRFVFAPSCRGVSAKRSQASHNSHGEMTDGVLADGSLPPSIISLEDTDTETQLTNRYQKRFSDLLRTSLKMKRTRSNDLTRYHLLLNTLEDLFGSNAELDD